MVSGQWRPVARSRRGGCLRWLLLLAFAAGAIVAMDVAWRVVEAPWSFGSGGRPTLTGRWEGPRRAALGREYRLYLELSHASSVSAGAESYVLSDNLQGEARLCSPTGDVWVYRVTGRANRAGDVIRLSFRTTVDTPPMPAPGEVQASWDGGGQLTVAGGYNPLMPDGSFMPSRIVSSADPDDSFVPATLVRADRDVFERACRQLRGRPE